MLASVKQSDGAPEREWTDVTGARWRARIVWCPQRPAEEREIQVDAENGAPERVLCLGMSDSRFARMSTEELELVRRAARSRLGILWVDPRDQQIWWVREGLHDPTRVQPTYANGRWSGFPRFHVGVPITFLKNLDHERLLDDARLKA